MPWLARTHAVTMVPSVSALQTLRKLPPGKPSRQDLIAFGDPYFSKEQADDAAESRQAGSTGRRIRHDARRAAEATQQPSTRRRRQCRTRHAAAAAGHRRRTQVHCAGAAGGSIQGAQSRQGRQREGGQDAWISRGSRSSPSPPMGWCPANWTVSRSRLWRCRRPRCRAPMATAC